jgi:hypothetical protein
MILVRTFTTDLLERFGRQRHDATTETSTMKRISEWRGRSLAVPQEGAGGGIWDEGGEWWFEGLGAGLRERVAIGVRSTVLQSAGGDVDAKGHTFLQPTAKQ